MSEHGYCDKCHKPLDEHPTVNVEGINTLALCQERAIKWEKVEPGTVIPAGQPYRVEYGKDAYLAAQEYHHRDAPWTVPEHATDWYVDSSWRPPLVLPTEPTWGIAHVKPYRDSDKTRLETGRCEVTGRYLLINGAAYSREPEFLLDFIPLTDEQVARIEAAR